jgi:predicted nuclease of predicted toxin-antitoxin system
VLKLLTDEHIDPDLIRGLLAREPGLDVLSLKDAGMLGADDRDILARAAAGARILVTHDRNAIPGFAYDRIRAGEPMPGVFVLDDLFPIGRAIEELPILSLCSRPEEWADQVAYVPM